MTDNVIEFPKKELEIEVDFNKELEEISQLIDMNSIGIYHALDVEPEQMMHSMFVCAALWAARAGHDDKEFQDILGTIQISLQVGFDGKES